jgi:molybdopterin converting factor small subunit
MNFVEIEVVKGQAFALKELSSDDASKPASLRLSTPDDSRIYSLRDLLSVLSLEYMQIEKEILDRQTGLLKGDTVIIVNGTNMDLLHGLDTSIKVGDIVTLIRFASGG